MYKTKAEKSTSPPGNLMMIAVFYHIIMIIGEYFLLGGLKLRYEVLVVYGVNGIFLECRSDEDPIFYDRNEC